MPLSFDNPNSIGTLRLTQIIAEARELLLGPPSAKSGPASQHRHGPAAQFDSVPLSRDHSDDLERARINDHDLVLDKEVIEAAILGHDPYDFARQRDKVHTSRNSSSD